MSVSGKGARIALIVLLLLLAGAGAYRAGLHFWGGYHYRAAEQALDRRDFTEAASHLKKCLDASPDNPAWRLAAARTARRQGEYALALDHLSVYQQKGGPEEALALERKLLVMQQGDLTHMDPLLSSCEERPQAAETPAILEAVIQGTQNGLRAAAAAGKPTPARYAARARQAADLWLRLRPGPADQVQGLVWRTHFLLLDQDRPGAVADLRKAVELAPGHFDARLQLAELVSQTNPREAADHLETLRRRFPEDNRVRFPLGLVRRSLGQLDEARQLLDDVLASEPDHAPALVARGQIALDTQQPAEAERWLRRAWTLEPHEPETNLALGHCLKMLGRAEEAKTYEDRFRRLKAGRNPKTNHPTHGN
jgi:tetratricopeptide (TPR) repeat protein